MSRIKSIYKNLPIIIVALIIIASTIASITIVNAAGGSFKKADVNWDGQNEILAASKDDTYPYNSSTATITSLSLDVLYGSKRDFVYYHGEFPYDCIYDSDEEYIEGWEGMYAEEGTSATDTNPSYGATATVSAADYWGTNLTADNFENQPTAEQINSGNMVSVRLWAASTTKTGFFMWLGQVGHSIVNGAAGIGTVIISVIVHAKNLNMNTILDILHLDDLNDALTKNFIYNGDTVSLSAFTGFCILALIVSLVAYVIRWVKGADKTKGIWEIIGTAAIGLLIIGISLSGRISSLGSSVATLANNVMYTATQALSSTGNGNAFVINVSDPGNETEITQMCEMALINKAYIDLQLCSQFNVSDISDLDFSKFGDTNGVEAKKYLSGVSGADMKVDFNNNLGYYFWFANSSAIDKTSQNATYPDTDTLSVTNKLSSMITYLQHQYNSQQNNADTAALIKRVTESFANPTGGPRFLALIIFAVALIMMAVVLLKYALNVIIGKIELFVALLGMIIAGPLMLTANKKLVKTGQMILGMLVVAFLEITVYSVIFDIIIYAVSSMFAPKIQNLLATIALLFLLLKFNPVIAQKIKELLERTERNISPALSDGKRALKNYARNKANEKIAAYDNKSRIVGYDANGNPIEEQRKGDALSKLMHQGANALLTEGHDRESSFKIGRDMKDARKANKAKSALDKRKAAQTKIDNELSNINNDAETTTREANAYMLNTENSAGEWDSDHKHLININEEGLNDSELEAKRNMDALEAELEDLKNMDRYKKLVAEQEHIISRNAEREANGEDPLEMDEKRKAELAGMKMKIAAKKKQIDTEKQKIEESIKERAAINAFRKVGLEYKGTEAGSIEDQLKAASREKALREHKDSLETTLKESIAAMTDEVNEGRTSVLSQTVRKIGDAAGVKSSNNLNREAATAQAAAMLQLSQLQNNLDVMDTNTAQAEVKDIVDKVATKYDGTMNNSARTEYDTAKDTYMKDHHFGTKTHAQTRENYKEAKKNFKDQKHVESNASKEALKEAKKQQNVSKVNILTASEFIQGQIDAKAAAANKTNIPNQSNTSSNVAQVVTKNQENRPNVVDTLTPPPVTMTSSVGKSVTSTPQPASARPQPAKQQSLPTKSVPDRPVASQTSTYESRLAEPTMAEARQSRVAVSQVEARQAQSRQAAQEPDMANIIKGRESTIQSPNSYMEQPPVHSRTDTRRSYEQDEARQMRNQADRDFYSDKPISRPGSRN